MAAWQAQSQQDEAKLLTVFVRSKSGSKQRPLSLLPNRKRTRRVTKKSVKRSNSPHSPPTQREFPPAQFVLDELAFTLAKDDGGKLTFSSTPSYRRSSKARADDQLTMVDTSLAKTCLLDYMGMTAGRPRSWRCGPISTSPSKITVFGKSPERTGSACSSPIMPRRAPASTKEDLLPSLTIISEGRLDMIERDLIREEQLESVRRMLL
ncbi:hypothetical protein GGG16DRAFT_118333 [Schizophyllum commune]